MNKSVCSLVVIFALASAGCNGKPQIEAPQKMPKTAVSPMPSSAVPVQGQVSQSSPNNPSSAVMLGGDPYSARTSKEIPFNFGKSGKVTQAMNAGGYTYLEVLDPKGGKIWLAVPETRVNVDDAIAFPDIPPLINFKSKTLNRSFEKISFVPGIRIVKK